MPNTAHQEVINSEEKTLKRAAVSTLSKEKESETMQTLDAAYELLKFSRVSTSNYPFNTSYRQLAQPPGQAKLNHIWNRRAVTYLMMWFNGARAVMPFRNLSEG